MTHEISHIGLVVIFGIVMLPVYVMLLGWVTGRPRDGRTLGLAAFYLGAFLLLVITGVVLLNTGLGLFRSL